MLSFSPVGSTQRKPKQTESAAQKESPGLPQTDEWQKDSLTLVSLARHISLPSFSMVFHAAVCRLHRQAYPCLLFTAFHFSAMVNSVYSKSRQVKSSFTHKEEAKQPLKKRVFHLGVVWIAGEDDGGWAEYYCYYLGLYFHTSILSSADDADDDDDDGWCDGKRR